MLYTIEPESRMVYKHPMCYEYLRTYQIYRVCAAKDFTVPLGVPSKDPIQRPNKPENKALDNKYQEVGNINK